MRLLKLVKIEQNEILPKLKRKNTDLGKRVETNK